MACYPAPTRRLDKDKKSLQLPAHTLTYATAGTAIEHQCCECTVGCGTETPG